MWTTYWQRRNGALVASDKRPKKGVFVVETGERHHPEITRHVFSRPDKGSEIVGLYHMSRRVKSTQEAVKCLLL